MEITFDPTKDERNVAKHGVSLTLAAEMAIEEALVCVDDRYEYGETRWNAYGQIQGKLYALTFALRDGVLRAISLRRCRKSEVDARR